MTLQTAASPASASPSVHAQGLMADILDINQELDAQAAMGAAPEEFLQAQLGRLPGRGQGMGMGPIWEYWPTLARLAELTLFSAGCLAMAGDFAGCGDLLINPPHKLLHVKGMPRPLALKRHGAITRQVAHLVPPGWQVIEWLKQNTYLEKPQKALLPRLRDELEHWPQAGEYLEALDRDWETLAGSLGLLVSLDMASTGGPQEAWAKLAPSERRSLRSHIYHPSLRRFRELGHLIANNEGGVGRCG
jgi:hypothetical protein